jgi:predicted nucleic acid-binding Zn ribbon protein
MAAHCLMCDAALPRGAKLCEACGSAVGSTSSPTSAQIANANANRKEAENRYWIGCIVVFVLLVIGSVIYWWIM